MAVECWRLERRAAGAGPEGAHARHAARRLGKFLDECELSVLDLTGQRYEGGLAVEVLDVTRDASLADGAEIIEEMIAPVVLWRGTVVRHGQAVVRRGTNQTG